MVIFYSIHHPVPGKTELLAESMHRFGEQMARQPGFIFVAPYPFRDPETGTLMGVSFWESPEALANARNALLGGTDDPPALPLESRPPEVYVLHSVK